MLILICECFHISLGMLHRDVNPTHKGIVVLVCFVGSVPLLTDIASDFTKIKRHFD